MNTVRSLQPGLASPYSQLDIEYDRERQLAWYFMHGNPRPCFTSVLAHEIQDWFVALAGQRAETDLPRYTVMASRIPGIYNLGGDLNLFCELIQRQDRDGLLRYAAVCNDILYRNHTGHGRGITTISLVQGDALGGGFEAALSSDVLIAEKSAKMGLPDILFNLFPGAGAYSLLARKVGTVQAERMVLSGRLYSGEEMHELGVVDVLAEDGQGEAALYEHIAKEEKMGNGIRGFRAAKRCTNPVTRDELMAAAGIWVETAMQLRDRDLRMMQRLVNRQTAKGA